MKTLFRNGLSIALLLTILSLRAMADTHPIPLSDLAFRESQGEHQPPFALSLSDLALKVAAGKNETYYESEVTLSNVDGKFIGAARPVEVLDLDNGHHKNACTFRLKSASANPRHLVISRTLKIGALKGHYGYMRGRTFTGVAKSFLEIGISFGSLLNEAWMITLPVEGDPDIDSISCQISSGLLAYMGSRNITSEHLEAFFGGKAKFLEVPVSGSNIAVTDQSAGRGRSISKTETETTRYPRQTGAEGTGGGNYGAGGAGSAR